MSRIIQRGLGMKSGTVAGQAEQRRIDGAQGPDVVVVTHLVLVPNEHARGVLETNLSCLHVILNEEWEHHRYAVRDLDVIEARNDTRR